MSREQHSDDRAAQEPAASRDAIDELTALFLTDPQQQSESADGPQDAPPATKPMRELLIAGHLPVRGNLWLTPYADAVARESGATALVRIDSEDEYSIQVLRGRTLPDAQHVYSARQLVDSLSTQIQAWVLRPAGPLQCDELVKAGADRITILSSSDAMAVVAAYKIIKDMESAARDAGVEVPEFGIAVVGAEQDAAAEMLQRLNQTTSSFLDTKVQLRMVLPRIDAGVRCTQHMNYAGDPSPRVADFFNWINHAQDEFADQASQDEPSMADVSHNPFQLSGMATETDGDDAVYAAASPSAKLSPKPSMHASATPQATAGNVPQRKAETTLAEHVEGLTLLTPRCPEYEHVELAADCNGALHVLAREAHLRDVQVVAAWARSHSTLLELACVDHSLDASGEPICHVFTETPASLADLHKTGLRLHLLTRINVGGSYTWYAAPLN